MKFGKDLKRQMVPEWVEGYMDYYGLKRILQEIHISKAQKLTQTPIRTLQQWFTMYCPFKGVEIEESIRTRLLLPCEEIGRENEMKFFKKLDQELDKVNAFYRNKVDEVIKEAAELKKQLQAFIALRIKVQNSGIKASEAAVAVESLWSTTQEAPSVNTGDGRENTGSTNDESDILKVLNCVKISTTFQGPLSMGRGKEQLKQVEKKLKVAFREFYQKLQLLKSYSFMNISAFAKITKKYEKTTSKWAARSYMKIVDKSYLGSCDELTKLIEDVEHLFVKNFLNANQRVGMKPLRPRKRREKHGVSFLSGLFSGCSIALVIVIILMVRARKTLGKEKGSFYMANMIGLYSLFLYIVLHMLVYAADIYLWQLYGINYTSILRFEAETTLSSKEVAIISCFLAFSSAVCIVLDTVLSETGHNHDYFTLCPLVVLLIILGIAFCPFNILYLSSRLFLKKCLKRCIFAPFFESTFPDFFLADQLISQVQAIRSLQFYICYYINRGLPEGQSKCHSSAIYNIFYFVVALLPYWSRFLQCIRKYVQEKQSTDLHNALKYLTTIVAVVIRTFYELKKGKTLFLLAYVSSICAMAYNIYWDIACDWELLYWDSINYVLRDARLVSYKSVYYIAMVVNVVLRIAWLQLVLFDVKGLHKTTISTGISCLEIIRRGIWNFFRLENEHLKTVVRTQDFISIPMSPTSYRDQGGTANGNNDNENSAGNDNDDAVNDDNDNAAEYDNDNAVVADNDNAAGDANVNAADDNNDNAADDNNDNAADDENDNANKNNDENANDDDNDNADDRD
ncbi:unnamed protein product [Amaranthus hypochondriacus]